MTTIACDGESMAGDGRTTSGSTIFGDAAIKVRQLKDGRIVGCSGSAYYGVPFGDWLDGDADLPEMDENFEALVLMPDGSCRSYDHKGRWIPEELPTAIGSGREFALVAMDLGASPAEAVEAAIRRDTGSGGTITSINRPRKLRRVA